MEGTDNTTLVAIIAAVVGVGQVLAKVIEKLVTGLLEERKRKSGKPSLEPGSKGKSGNTTDIALQRRSLETVMADLDETKRVAYDTKAAVTKDLPHLLERVGNKLDDVVGLEKEAHHELRELRRAIDNNTAATKALHNFLASQSSR